MSTTCIILFIIGVILIMCTIGLVAYHKGKKSRNKVRFYVQKTEGTLFLTIGKESRSFILAIGPHIKYFGLLEYDFRELKEGDIVEVFLNLED